MKKQKLEQKLEKVLSEKVKAVAKCPKIDLQRTIFFEDILEKDKSYWEPYVYPLGCVTIVGSGDPEKLFGVGPTKKVRDANYGLGVFTGAKMPLANEYLLRTELAPDFRKLINAVKKYFDEQQLEEIIQKIAEKEESNPLTIVDEKARDIYFKIDIANVGKKNDAYFGDVGISIKKDLGSGLYYVNLDERLKGLTTLDALRGQTPLRDKVLQTVKELKNLSKELMRYSENTKIVLFVDNV
ncbi:MAG: hypothetical protein QXW65_02095 [Candidatus Pacearchaeota archaeon]